MIGAIILILVGLLFGILGCLLAIGQKINLRHRYHYARVTKENKKAFCFLSGLGVVFIGFGILLSGVLIWITGSELSLIAIVNGLIVGTGMLVIAGIKYI